MSAAFFTGVCTYKYDNAKNADCRLPYKSSLFTKLKDDVRQVSTRLKLASGHCIKAR